MDDLRYVERSGAEALATVTDLARRIRLEHPTRGVWEAADFQWWWRRPRESDTAAQRFWLDDADRPVAAGMVTDWGDRVAVDVLTIVGAEDLADAVWEEAVDAARRTGKPLEAMVDLTDGPHLARLERDGFEDSGARGGSAWIATASVPTSAPVAAGYRLVRRSEASPGSVHHFAHRNGPDVETRLRATSLYRPDLDLAIVDPSEAVVAYGLFWWDPVSRTGFVEPMGTDEQHRRRGLARAVLRTGLSQLAALGATRVRINYDADHEPSRTLYLGAGFQPAMTTALFVRR